MNKSKTKSFIAEIPIVISRREEKVILDGFEVSRRLYNSYLGECLDRLGKMRNSKGWSLARKVKDKELKKEAFKKLHEEFNFKESSIHEFAKNCRNNGNFTNRIGSLENQVIATRAFRAVNEYKLNKRGKPRFKGRFRTLESIENKSNYSGLRYNLAIKAVEYRGLTLFLKHKSLEKDLWLKHALNCRTKFCRLIHRNIKGKTRWFIQLIQEGTPLIKYETNANQEVGLDVGPSTIAIVSNTSQSLVKFASSVEQPWKESRLIQRKMDRSRRATNEDCFNENGTYKKGSKIKTRSNNYLKLQNEYREIERVLKVRRKREHGNLTNKILSQGNIIKTEKLSYKSFQKNFGRSTKVRAPGLFMNLLAYKAERADGKLSELNTQILKLSQFDHIRNDYQKKKLSDRWHKLGYEETFVQRDIYSAFLAMVSSEKTIQLTQAENAWAIVNPQLVSTGWIRNKTAIVDRLLETTNNLAKPIYSSERLSLMKSKAIDSRLSSSLAKNPSSSYSL